MDRFELEFSIVAPVTGEGKFNEKIQRADPVCAALDGGGNAGFGGLSQLRNLAVNLRSRHWKAKTPDWMVVCVVLLERVFGAEFPENMDSTGNNCAFGLINEESLSLMRLAEALLRIPDNNTKGELIADKIFAGDRREHFGVSKPALINAATVG